MSHIVDGSYSNPTHAYYIGAPANVAPPQVIHSFIHRGGAATHGHRARVVVGATTDGGRPLAAEPELRDDP